MSEFKNVLLLAADAVIYFAVLAALVAGLTIGTQPRAASKT